MSTPSEARGPRLKGFEIAEGFVNERDFGPFAPLRVTCFSASAASWARGTNIRSPLTAYRSPLTVFLPRDPVVLSVIARGPPHRPMQPVEQNSVDRARGPLLEVKRIPHLLQRGLHAVRRSRGHQHMAGLRFMFSERRPHLIAVDVVRLRRLLRRHPELNDVQ